MNDSLQSLGPEGKGTGSNPSAVIELNRILAPVDFSPASSRGLVIAARVAEWFHSKLDLIYVIEPPSLPEWGYAYLEIREANLRKSAEEKLQVFPMECGIDPRLVRSEKVRSGEAEYEICQAAIDEKADLIVLASHGLGGFKHALIGSTCERVVRRAPCPVLTVRESTLAKDGIAGFAPKRILVTTDFSEASKKAFSYAAALARRFEASVLLVYVVPNPLPAELTHLGIILQEQRILSEAREQLPLFRRSEIDPHIHIETLVLHGNPQYEICKTAATHGTDLIIMSTHGNTGLKRLAIGSVTERVVRHAPCAVLVVREQEHEFLHGKEDGLKP